MHVGNDRLESFCDGIFGFAITLLILEIKIPDFTNAHSPSDIWNGLINQWPSWFAFGLSFITLLIAWVNHHHVLKLLDKTSSVFIYANGFLTLTVIVFTFSTGLLGRSINTNLAQPGITLYCLSNFFHALAWLSLFSAALHPKDLSKNETSRQKVIGTRSLIAKSCISTAVITVLSFWFPTIALCLVTASWAIYLISGIFQTSLD
jgi:uncharacterized membrane protein